jgi:Ni,Fe-hydrogenase III large subunit/formate hydrogenlyase subunit 3/multisubunit Na+/H+ antiporter MnhD subunit
MNPILLTALVPALGALLTFLPPLRRVALKLLLLVAVVNFGVSVSLTVDTPASAVIYFGADYFVFDATTQLFISLINLVFLGIAAFLLTHAKPFHGHRGFGYRFARYSLGFMAASNLGILSNHLLMAWAFVEATTLFAVPLIGHDRTVAAWRAAWRYLLLSTVGLSLAFLGFVCLERSVEVSSAQEGLSFFLHQLDLATRSSQTFAHKLGILLVLFGYGTKLGLAPMYSWLPETYDTARPPVTTLLAAVQFNVVFVALFRVLQSFGASDQELIRDVLTAMGLASLVVSAVSIVATRNYKRIIAFASINHAGAIALGLGVGGSAIYGVLLYAVSNALVKAVLFLTAGEIEEHFGTLRTDEVDGLLTEMPFSGIFLMFGTFALLGFAPFGSFVGELVMMGGMIEAGQTVLFAVLCLILLVVFVATGRSMFPMIWASGPRPHDRQSEPAGRPRAQDLVPVPAVHPRHLRAAAAQRPDPPGRGDLRRRAVNTPTVCAEVRALPSLPADEFTRELARRLAHGEQLITYFGRPGDGPDEVVLTAALRGPEGLHLLRGAATRGRPLHALTRDWPAVHVFERELHEQRGLAFTGHPWLKPLRFEGENLGRMDDYPFFHIDGKEVHEVNVGPIHAGVIEPGAFRFSCHGEVVYHLEIHNGYQHRGAERLLIERPLAHLPALVERIAGDSSIAYAWTHAAAIEALAGREIDVAVECNRGVGLELERIAMHLVGLAGMTTDIGFLQGSSTYGRIRTAAINASMRVCGSRFGRDWLRPGGVRAPISAARVDDLRDTVRQLARDIGECNALSLAARTVQHRLKGTGVVTREQAVGIGLVGMHARACGVDMDMRVLLPGAAHRAHPVRSVVEQAGDCWSRFVLRVREIDESVRWLLELLDSGVDLTRTRAPVGPLAPDAIAVAVTEGWRGPVVHAVETDAAGRLRHYKVQDPSLHNWFGLALAVRNNEISDFPICNKSFDLSYAGTDL